MLPLLPLALMLALQPWTGPPAPGTVAAARISVDVRGRAGQLVRLRALDVPPGYVASFCTRRVCAPFAVAFVLPRSGREALELQLIENVPGARRPAFVRVSAGAASASIAFARVRS